MRNAKRRAVMPVHPPERARYTLSLNGMWQIAPGDADASPVSWERAVPVPSLVDAADPPYAWQEARYHWYRKLFAAPEAGAYARCVLRIDQAMFGTELRLNGTRAGGDIACYTSQEYDITSLLRSEGENELLVRVGARETLPPESAVGRDQERTTFIPGIWGDVSLIWSGPQRIDLVQVIPHIRTSRAEARITVHNGSSRKERVRILAKIVCRSTGRSASTTAVAKRTIGRGGSAQVRLHIHVNGLRLWSPEDPFLYQLETAVYSESGPSDLCRTTFGMREFTVSGGDFLLNGRKILLRGGNIAWHRMLSSSDRGSLPWDPAWIRRALIEIPRAHHFNFFRNHLGQMYNRWYDIADEHGMLIQNEWQFWTVSGTRRQIRREFTRWLQDNWNHPSIIIWDPLNESSDRLVQERIVPEMKALDPTRPWESVDFLEEHPYIYSLGPVLNDRRFGFTRSLKEIGKLRTPSMLNEFLWWWLDRDGAPTPLTQEVVERWLGRHPSRDDLLAHQAFLAQELVELFRRMGVDAIQPFVYLSSNEGPTSHWFLGPLAELRPKPVLAALRNAFAPLGVSIDLWDRHFIAGSRRKVRVHVLNDHPDARRGLLRCDLVHADGSAADMQERVVQVKASRSRIVDVGIRFPSEPGEYRVRAQISEARGAEPLAVSEKVAHVLPSVSGKKELKKLRIALLSTRPEAGLFLRAQGAHVADLRTCLLEEQDVVAVDGAAVRGTAYARRLHDISAWVEAGGRLVVLEPEHGLDEGRTVPATRNVLLAIERREDADRGGYDTYVFMEDPQHPLWRGLRNAHLRFFNGAYGGEIVSQHAVTPLVPHTVLARCGLRLATIAAAEIGAGAGCVLLSRLQVRGRLARSRGPVHTFDRREDPVAQRYLINLVHYAAMRR